MRSFALPVLQQAPLVTMRLASLKGRSVEDLRNDAGGLLDAAVEAAADFLDSGTVVTTRGRDPDENRVYEASPNGDLIRSVPMVVLVNGASASAAEIVAGALQDNHRGVLLGTRSFGKGSVQSIIPIEGHGALRLTTALYYTPSGRSIQGQGVTPDQVVTLPKDQQVPNALVTYESDLYGSLKPTGALAPTKALDKAIVIRNVQLESKSGGKSGDYAREGGRV